MDDFKRDMTIPDIKRSVLKEHQSRVEQLFKVKLTFGLKSSDGFQWIAIVGTEHDTAEAQAYICALCSPQQVVTMHIPIEAYRYFASPDKHRELEKDYKCVILLKTQSNGTGVLEIYAQNALNATLAQSAIEDMMDTSDMTSACRSTSKRLDEEIHRRLSAENYQISDQELQSYDNFTKRALLASYQDDNSDPPVTPPPTSQSFDSPSRHSPGSKNASLMTPDVFIGTKRISSQSIKSPEFEPLEWGVDIAASTSVAIDCPDRQPLDDMPSSAFNFNSQLTNLTSATDREKSVYLPTRKKTSKDLRPNHTVEAASVDTQDTLLSAAALKQGSIYIPTRKHTVKADVGKAIEEEPVTSCEENHTDLDHYMAVAWQQEKELTADHVRAILERLGSSVSDETFLGELHKMSDMSLEHRSAFDGLDNGIMHRQSSDIDDDLRARHNVRPGTVTSDGLLAFPTPPTSKYLVDNLTMRPQFLAHRPASEHFDKLRNSPPTNSNNSQPSTSRGSPPAAGNYDRQRKLRQEYEDRITASSHSSSSDEEAREPKPRRRKSSPVPASTSNLPPVDLMSSRLRKDSSDLRYIILDGSNVAMHHGDHKVFSCKGIEIAVNFFLKRGHKAVKAIVPKWRLRSTGHPISNHNLLQEMYDKKLIVWGPSRRVGERTINYYDDRMMLDLAVETDGIVVTNDNYRDLFQEEKYQKVIEKNILPFTFVDDMLLVPSDPLGQNGPTLDEYLRKSTNLSSYQQVYTDMRFRPGPSNPFNQPQPRMNQATNLHPRSNSSRPQPKFQAPNRNGFHSQTNGYHRYPTRNGAYPKTTNNFTHVQSDGLLPTPTDLPTPLMAISNVVGGQRKFGYRQQLAGEQHNRYQNQGSNNNSRNGQSYTTGQEDNGTVKNGKVKRTEEETAEMWIELKKVFTRTEDHPLVERVLKNHAYETELHVIVYHVSAALFD